MMTLHTLTSLQRDVQLSTKHYAKSARTRRRMS